MNNNTRKHITACILSSAVLATSMTSFAAEAVNFRDVSSTAWYYEDIQTASERGIINGKGANLFDPQGNLSVAEAIKLASCARASLNDELDGLEPDTSGTIHWVVPYMDYAVKMGIIDSSLSDAELNSYITRDGMAKIFAKALPDSQYKDINDLSLIPDSNVPDYVKKLFKAGIMIGDEDNPTFRLNDNITRAETACIINRVLLPKQRQVVEKPVEETTGKFKALPYYTEASQRPTYNPKTVYVTKVTADGPLQSVSTTPSSGREKINVLYNHTYFCSNQEEYDAVMTVVNEAYDHVMKNYEMHANDTKAFQYFLTDKYDYATRENMQPGYLFNRFISEGTDVAYEVIKVYDIHSHIFDYINYEICQNSGQGSGRTHSAYGYLFENALPTCEACSSIEMAIWDVMGYNSCIYASSKANHAAPGFEINGKWFIHWITAFRTPEDTKAQYAPDLRIQVQPTI